MEIWKLYCCSICHQAYDLPFMAKECEKTHKKPQCISEYRFYPKEKFPREIVFKYGDERLFYKKI